MIFNKFCKSQHMSFYSYNSILIILYTKCPKFKCSNFGSVYRIDNTKDKQRKKVLEMFVFFVYFVLEKIEKRKNIIFEILLFSKRNIIFAYFSNNASETGVFRNIRRFPEKILISKSLRWQISVWSQHELSVHCCKRSIFWIIWTETSDNL